MSPIRLLTFDVTGTLLHFRTPVMTQYSEIAANFGIKSDPAKLMPHFKKSWKVLQTNHPNFGQSTGLGWREWWHQIVRSTFAEHIYNEEERARVRVMADFLIDHFETEKAWKIADGAGQLIDSLIENNIAIGVISNFDPRLHAILDNVGLKGCLSFVLTSYEVGYEKPDARIFHAALKKLNLSRGDEAVHVGNDPRLDYSGATTAGLHAILVSEDSPLVIPKLVNQIREVIDCIDYINRVNRRK